MLSGEWGTFFIVDEEGDTYGCFSTFDEAARGIERLFEDNVVGAETYLSIERD